jgi:formylglycine-generating enzyme required for sulfatase activity
VNPDGTRRPRPRPELLQGLSPSATEVVERLLGHRLLVARREAGEAEAVVELAHEALATAWPRLEAWLNETRGDRRLRAEIEQAAALWAARGRPDDETWAGAALARAARGTAEGRVDLSAEARAFLEAGERRERRRARRRALALGGTMGALALVAAASAAAAVAFAEKEKEAIRQQEQIRLAAADMGLFELELAPFDWDESAQAPSPPAGPLALEWRLYAVDAADPHAPGRPYGAGDLRRGGPRLAGASLRERVEARSGPALLEVRGRGGACAPSWVRLRHLPGYDERAPAAPPALRVAVPTCQASGAGSVAVPAGEFFRNVDGGGRIVDEPAALPAFAIDRTEVTRAAFGQYAALEPLTGDAAAPAPHLRPGRPGEGRLPVVGVNFFTARNYCRFMGKDLPSVDQWQKALRGGASLGGEANPAPGRLTPWAAARSAHPANLDDAGDGHDDLAPVGAFLDDASPYGVADLAGNVSEWSLDRAPSGPWRGLRLVLGGNWDLAPALNSHLVTWRNTRPDRYLDFAIGLRCVAAAP